MTATDKARTPPKRLFAVNSTSSTSGVWVGATLVWVGPGSVNLCGWHDASWSSVNTLGGSNRSSRSTVGIARSTRRLRVQSLEPTKTVNFEVDKSSQVGMIMSEFTGDECTLKPIYLNICLYIGQSRVLVDSRGCPSGSPTFPLTSILPHQGHTL